VEDATELALDRPLWRLNEERPIITQPQCVRCHRAGTGQATLEVIGSKQSYAVKWCKPNNDDDAVLKTAQKIGT